MRISYEAPSVEITEFAGKEAIANSNFADASAVVPMPPQG